MILSDEYIRIETAKLAKEAGFDIKTDHAFSRPLQSTLQKWLREEHNIHIVVYCLEKSLDNGWEIYFDFALKKQTKLGALDNISQKVREFKTYEESLEAGLQEALKLIKDED